MSNGNETGRDGQRDSPTAGGVRVLHWVGMILLITLALAGAMWGLKVLGRA